MIVRRNDPPPPPSGNRNSFGNNFSSNTHSNFNESGYARASISYDMESKQNYDDRRSSLNSDSKEIRCYKCNEIGHFAYFMFIKILSNLVQNVPF